MTTPPRCSPRARPPRHSLGLPAAKSRPAKLRRVEPEHLAAAVLGVEPQEGLIRIGALQPFPATADLAQQAAPVGQVLAGLVNDASDQRQTIVTAGQRQTRLVAAFRR